MNMYKVIAKCGHVGRKNYIPITFAIKANDGKEAAKIARTIPRVKHHHKDAIINVKKIDISEYLKIKEQNNNDPYLGCKSKQEQNLYNLNDRILKEENIDNEKAENVSKEKIYYKKILIKKPKKFIKLNKNYMEEYVC